MKAKKLLSLLPLLGVLLTGCDKKNDGAEKKDEKPEIQMPAEYQEIKVMSCNLDQAHQNLGGYHTRIVNRIAEVRPDLVGVQEEGDGWVRGLQEPLEEYGYKHIYKTRGGSFSEASGIFINTDRFEVKESGTFWFGKEEDENKEAFVASYWGALYPRICTWALLYDKYTKMDISYFNAHYEYDHPFGKDGNPTATDNTADCRKRASEQVIRHMEALGVPGFFTGDLNFWKEEEPTTYATLTNYFDDSWANFEGHQEMCTFHNYGAELDASTREHPYSPIDYIFSTKGDFTVKNFTIMNNEGNSEQDFDSDHFFIHANFSFNSITPVDPPSPVDPTPIDPPTPVPPTVDEKGITVMSANLDQAHDNNTYYKNKVLGQFEKVNPDLLGVQEENAGWKNQLESTMSSRGYTHIYQSRGGSFPEGSGIFIKNSRFDIKESGTFWFCADKTHELESGYIETAWGASFPRICTWALLHDKLNDTDVAYFNAHLEYDHEFGNMNGDASAESNTIACRMNSCKQVIDHIRALKVPAIFTGDLNSYRSLEPAVYQTCLSYFDDAWAKCGSEKICSWHNYGVELNSSTRQNPYEPIDYIYSTKGKFTANNFTIMSNQGNKESDFDSDHFFVYSNLSLNWID